MKINKKIIMMILIFVISFSFIDVVHAAKCRDLDYNSCIGAIDDSGVSCEPTVLDGQTVCAPTSCSAYNDISVYGYTITPNRNLTDCVADSRCTFYRDTCVPKVPISKSGKYTCEDFGKARNIFGEGEKCFSEIGSECELNSDGWCVTVQENTKFKLCMDYTNETECNKHTKEKGGDDGGNGCLWNVETSTCDQVYDKDKANAEYEKKINDRPTVIVNNVSKTDGNFVCSDVKYLTNAWLLIRIAAPFIIILFGSLDFFKSIVAGDEKKMKESRGKFLKRLIAFILLILLPFIIQLIFSIMGTYGSDNICLLKCIATNNTSAKGCD